MYQKMTEEEATERLFSRFWNNTLIGDGCWEWIGSKTKKGYGRISVMREGAWKVEVASRVAWFLSTGEWPILPKKRRTTARTAPENLNACNSRHGS